MAVAEGGKISSGPVPRREVAMRADESLSRGGFEQPVRAKRGVVETTGAERKQERNPMRTLNSPDGSMLYSSAVPLSLSATARRTDAPNGLSRTKERGGVEVRGPLCPSRLGCATRGSSQQAALLATRCMERRCCVLLRAAGKGVLRTLNPRTAAPPSASVRPPCGGQTGSHT